MNTQDFKRKLTAVFSADVAGYSRLMGEDEAATVKTLEAYKQVMFSLIKQHRGRVIDSPGDNLLAEFASVVDAVQCGVAIQKELQARNAELPENRKMQFRIGINLGDVIEEQDRIYGDGVNIAARLEALAEGGGIRISGTAFDQVENKLELGFEYLGEQVVKNIRKPVRVYRVGLDSVAAGIEMGKEPPLSDKPSIAVLPFENMSGDLEQEYFSDGMAEDIITALSRIPDVFVIARNSSFTYKGKPVDVRQVGRELGVRYVLEGSLRKASDSVRITAQLIDASTGHHLWGERYDRDLKDIFAIQDEITLKILKSLQVILGDGEETHRLVKRTANIDAYLKMAQSRSYLYRFDRGGNLRARELCEEAIALDQNWDSPYSILGFTHYMDAMFGWSDSREQSAQKAFQLGQMALSLCESATAHSLLASIYTLARVHDMAIEESRKSIALDPNSADAHASHATALVYAGEPSKAIPLLEKAIQLNPFPPSLYFTILGAAHRQIGNVEKALETYKKAIYKEPTNLIAHIGLAVCYFTSGQEEEARTQAQEILKIDPSFSVEYFEKTVPYKDRAITERLVDALRKIGLK
jgi:adenylate cyclase